MKKWNESSEMYLRMYIKGKGNGFPILDTERWAWS